jgi:hypothetical protein
LQGEHGPLSPNVRQQSGSGGRHYLYARPESATEKRIRFRAGLDFLTGAGSYIVVAPSWHASGGQYQWVDNINPLSAPRGKLPLQPAPEWLLRAASETARTPIQKFLDEAYAKVHTGNGRNDTGYWLFCQIRDERYSHEEASAVLSLWVTRVNELTPGEPPYTAKEAEETLKSAYKRKPREPRARRKESQADTLLKLIDDFEYFKSGPANDAYVRMAVGNHREVWAANGPRVREVLTWRFLETHGRAPSRDALNNAIDTVAARCGAGRKENVHVRFARSCEAIYLDLCNDEWQAIEIKPDGWQVVTNPPVLFRRLGDHPKPAIDDHLKTGQR